MPSHFDNAGRSPWPHRWATILACATFVLLCVGGIVTTTKAGMAVKDWPTTNGYNMFLYPWLQWLQAPRDFFVEHGHRLLASSVGMMTIVLLVLLWRKEERHWVRWLGVLALGLVVFQGILGGMRVRLDERTFAMLHGMTGPLFFTLTVAITVFTSRSWIAGATTSREQTNGDSGTDTNNFDHRGGSQVRVLATVTAILVYLQIVLGALLRHMPVDAEPTAFTAAVRFHLFLAGILTLHIALLVYFVLRFAREAKPLGALGLALVVILAVQLVLGAATWIVKYSVPAFASGWFPASNVPVQDGGWLQTVVVTGHVAMGSLLLATAVALAIYSHRLLGGAVSPKNAGIGRLGAAI
jgi:cytochrome c oxidase assembly protein subunit 15